MRIVRRTLSLLAWLCLYIPTTLFILAAMTKTYFGQAREREKTPS